MSSKDLLRVQDLELEFQTCDGADSRSTPKFLLPETCISSPHCDGLSELPFAQILRDRMNKLIEGGLRQVDPSEELKNVFESDHALGRFSSDSLPADILRYVASGHACTTGSAVSKTPPSRDECLDAYLVTNRVGLTAGARAWSKHAHRSEDHIESPDIAHPKPALATVSNGWWGKATGPLAHRNEKALELFHKIWDSSPWRNLHWLPHEILAYEIRVKEGYGMRWSRSMAEKEGEEPWIFRGFVEPMMENGHELRWRHPVASQAPKILDSQLVDDVTQKYQF